MNKTQKKFILYAVLAVFVLLAVLLGVLNAVSFTKAAEDADHVTQQIADGRGVLGPREGGANGPAEQPPDPSGGPGQNGQGPDPNGGPGQNGQAPDPNGGPGQNGQGPDPSGSPGPAPTGEASDPSVVTPDPNAGEPDPNAGTFDPNAGKNGPAGRMGPMGPDSPELNETMRYFTVAFDADGNGTLVSYRISAVTEEEALSWAESLKKETTGWTRMTYRYRVYSQNGQTLVTVVDQGRELLSAYRILLCSAIGLVVFTALSFLILRLVGRRLFAPLADADRKQKEFIAEAEQAFKLPLTVISAETEILERTHGPSEQTRSIHRQVRNMNSLVGRLGSLSLSEDEKLPQATFSLSELLEEMTERSEEIFSARGITLSREIEANISLDASPEVMERVIAELLENAEKYASSRAEVRLERQSERIRLTVSNDTSLPDGAVDQCFDRFTTLSNATADSTGLGLAVVRDVVRSMGGRVSARVENGCFFLRVDL